MKHKKRLTAVVVVLLCLPATALSDGPCGCEDICKMEKRLKERERLLAVARQVAEEAKDKTFPTSEWYKERFVEIAFPDGNYTVEGTQKYGEEPTVSEEHKKSSCEGEWKATEAHERDHAEFDKTLPNWKYPWVMIFGQEGGFLARKEVSGYAAEVEYLRNELEKLRTNCPEADCEPEEPVMERYQENDQAQRAEQKLRVERAAERVAAYANSIN